MKDDLKYEKTTVKLFGNPTYAILVDNTPHDLQAFRPDPRGVLKINTRYPCICGYEDGKLRVIMYPNKKHVYEFQKIR